MIKSFLKEQRDRICAATPRLCFLHVPKCGGSSVRRSLVTQAYTPLQRALCEFFILNTTACEAATALDARPFSEIAMSLASYHLMRPNCVFIRGHFHCTPDMIDGARDRWRFVTILRHQVNRFLSAYTFDRHKTKGPFTHEVGIEEFLDSQRGFYEGRIYLYHFSTFSRRADAAPETVAACHREALETLGKFDLVGVTEDMAGWSARFEALVGRKLSIPRVNQNPRPDVMDALRADRRIMARIEQLCAEDMEIYERCRAKTAI